MLHFTTGTGGAARLLVPRQLCQQQTHAAPVGDAGKNESRAHKSSAQANHRKERGWPEFLYYPVDEPSTAPDSVNFMLKVLKACKAAGVRTYVTADPTH